MSTADLETWRAQRHTAVTAPAGNLALVEYLPVTHDSEPESVPGLKADLPEDGAEGVYLTPPAGIPMAVDGVEARGRTFVGRLQPDGTPLVTIDRFTIDVFSLDGSDYELRIYDPHSRSRQVFDHIECYDENPACVVEGRFESYADTESVAWGFTRDTDTGHTKKVPGEVIVTIGGEEYRLLAFLNGEQMILVYADGTTGKESYAPGKFLAVPAPDAEGRVVLDFNYSFIPPCGFSYSYSCPIPPAQNRIRADLRAGEKVVVFNGER